LELRTVCVLKILILLFFNVIVYYVIRSKNEALCGVAGRLAAERSEADKPAKAHKTIFAPNNIYYFIFKGNKTIKRTPLERNFCDLNY
jgi:hypothetical protein